MIESVWSLISNEAFLGAVIGGVLAAVGSMSALVWQQRLHARDRRDTARAIFKEHGRHIQQLLDKLISHYENRNEIWFEYTSRIETVTNVVDRNLEWLAIIGGSEEAERIRNYFYEALYASKRSVGWQNRLYELDNSKTKEENSKKIAEIDGLIREVKTEIRNSVVTLKQIRLNGKSIF
ncbi:hypothetical protein NVS89_09955 [Ancylobacter sp. MQZ15Z-1]|uniref:Uncharacterized protein n=1 Tax=Ancylobacter mangrovi TaxID=2972472 RepID=A0A9X2PHR3_9HYPH|nr:hypothetical protein [Ancylobacter mangrovi]MCS0495422.1 hypothetical protein [Ancylobacter mangrovi]